ncbi:PAS domain-containing sensor histidine kinase, partial [Methanoregula sp.]|uniref:PAS domain-containing sensor histidine kinase n=1 Tax=Methanoregula sp. TaxID=2052170 RepID=UPI000CBB16DC
AECIGRRITFGKTREMLVSFRDGTDRKTAEEELKDSEEFVNTILENIPDMIFVKDAGKLRFVRFNRAGEELLGYSREDLYGKSDYDFFPKEEADFFTEKDREVLRNGIIADIPEEVIQTKDKGERILHTKKIPIPDRDGNARYLLGISEDITERRRADEELRESEKKFVTIFQNNPVPLTLTTAGRGVFADVNEAFLASTGYLREEVIGKTPGELSLFVNPDDITRLVTELRLKHQVRGMDLPCRTKNGEVRICRFSSRVIMMGSTPHVISTVEDVTEGMKTEDALHQANKKLHLLSSITRHDIKNQLMTLDGYVSLMDKKSPAGCEQEIARIRKVSRQISGMIQFTKDYQQVGIASPVWMDIRALVNDAEKGVSQMAVTVRNDIPAGTEVYADPLIAKVFFNLVDNAVRHGGSVTTIRFSLAPHDGKSTIVCEDDGTGIAPEMKKKLFQKGFGKNNGFGLFLSREVLDITGITIQETGEPGKGARFEMSIPNESFRITAGK